MRALPKAVVLPLLLAMAAQAAAQKPATRPDPPTKLALPLRPPAKLPPSMRLMLHEMGRKSFVFEIDRGGVLVLESEWATGLNRLVADSGRAEALAREAHGDLITGGSLMSVGFGLAGLSLANVVYLENRGGTGPRDPLFWSALSGFLVSAVLEGLGASFWKAGKRKVINAVDAYNADVVVAPLQSSATPGTR